jgi:transposase
MGAQYVVAAKLRGMNKGMKKQFLTDRQYKVCIVGGDVCWSKEYKQGKDRLIVSYSSRRAIRDQKNRDRHIQRFYKKSKGEERTMVATLINNGNGKYIKKEGQTAELDQEKIKEDELWDGLHGVITNDSEASASQILSTYRQLWQIEAAFRLSKTDLKMRPIYHWKQNRIEAHILICYIALAVGKFTMERINKQLGQNRRSLEKCVEELLRVESSILRNNSLEDQNIYILPSNMKEGQRKIYESLNLQRRLRSYALSL